MSRTVGIYLSGSIKKGHENSEETFWTDEDMATIRKSLSEYEMAFLNPAFRTDNLTDNHSVFGRDMTQVFCSHAVFVDARDRRGLGVGAEMMWAKIYNIPVVTWSPQDSHYNKTRTTILDTQIDNFIHPFVQELSDKIVATLEEGALWIKKILSDPSVEIKGIKHIHASMKYYQQNQLPLDLPMRKILSCETLNARLSRPLIEIPT